MGADEAKKLLKTKQLRVVKLQQDLFVMTVEAVYKQLEEEKIWQISAKVRDKFNAASMYEAVLKRDIAWRNWQWFVRESITNYLRENKMVTQTENGKNKSEEMNDSVRDLNVNAQANDTSNDDEVMKFLRHYKLQKYDGKLRDDAGLESLDDLKALSEDDIVNIAKEVSMATLHQNKFVNACKELQNGMYPPKKLKRGKSDMSNREIDEFLKKYKLAKYSDALRKHGFIKLRDISRLNMEELDTLASECKMATLHKKKFIAACTAYKKYVKSRENKKHNASSPQSGKSRRGSVFSSFRGNKTNQDEDGCFIM